METSNTIPETTTTSTTITHEETERHNTGDSDTENHAEGYKVMQADALHIQPYLPNKINKTLSEHPLSEVNDNAYNITQAIANGNLMSYIKEQLSNNVNAIKALVAICIQNSAIKRAFRGFATTENIENYFLTSNECENIRQINELYFLVAMLYRIESRRLENLKEIKEIKEKIQYKICLNPEIEPNQDVLPQDEILTVLFQQGWNDLLKIQKQLHPESFSQIPKTLTDVIIKTNNLLQILDDSDAKTALQEKYNILNQIATAPWVENYLNRHQHLRLPNETMQLLLALTMIDSEYRETILNKMVEKKILISDFAENEDQFTDTLRQTRDVFAFLKTCAFYEANNPFSVNDDKATIYLLNVLFFSTLIFGMCLLTGFLVTICATFIFPEQVYDNLTAVLSDSQISTLWFFPTFFGGFIGLVLPMLILAIASCSQYSLYRTTLNPEQAADHVNQLLAARGINTDALINQIVRTLAGQPALGHEVVLPRGNAEAINAVGLLGHAANERDPLLPREQRPAFCNIL